MSIVHLNDKNFNEEVLKAELPVLVDFFAEWCGPCKMLAPVLEDISREYSGKIKVVKVDVVGAGSTASQFGIMSVPTLMIFKDGKALSQNVGAMSKYELKNKLADLYEVTPEQLLITRGTDEGIWRRIRLIPFDYRIPEGGKDEMGDLVRTFNKMGSELKKKEVLKGVFNRYVSQHVADEIFRDPESIRLGGDRREVTVFFADIRGFTALSETMNPDAMAKHLTEYFTEMVDVVFRNDGTSAQLEKRVTSFLSLLPVMSVR